MTEMERVRLEVLDDPDAREVVHAVTDLVNAVYADAEDTMWTPGTARTDTDDMRRIIAAGEMTAAWFGDVLAGCLRTVRVDATTVELGMVSADPRIRGKGVGRALVAFAENRASGAGYDTVLLEVIRPRDYALPSKEFLAQWYPSLGYRLVSTAPIESSHPELVSTLVVPCEVDLYRKSLS